MTKDSVMKTLKLRYDVLLSVMSTIAFHNILKVDLFAYFNVLLIIAFTCFEFLLLVVAVIEEMFVSSSESLSLLLDRIAE